MQGLSELPLRDIRLPAEPSIWPLAPGWWIVIVLLIIVLFMFIRFLVKKNKNQKITNHLLNEISIINNKHKSNKNDHQLASDLSLYLKRLIKFGMNNQKAPQYNSEKWLEYLNQLIPNHAIQNHKKDLTQAIWNPKAKLNASALISAVRDFTIKLSKQGKLEL